MLTPHPSLVSLSLSLLYLSSILVLAAPSPSSPSATPQSTLVRNSKYSHLVLDEAILSLIGSGVGKADVKVKGKGKGKDEATSASKDESEKKRLELWVQGSISIDCRSDLFQRIGEEVMSTYLYHRHVLPIESNLVLWLEIVRLWLHPFRLPLLLLLLLPTTRRLVRKGERRTRKQQLVPTNMPLLVIPKEVYLGTFQVFKFALLECGGVRGRERVKRPMSWSVGRDVVSIRKTDRQEGNVLGVITLSKPVWLRVSPMFSCSLPAFFAGRNQN